MSKTTCVNSSLQQVTESDISTGVFSIPNDTVFIGVERLTTDSNLEVIIITLCPATLQSEAVTFVTAHICVCINTSTECPMLVDFCNWLKTENPVVSVDFILNLCAVGISAVCTMTLVGVLNLALPDNFVGIFFEVAYANAEVVEFISKFSCETIKSCFISTADVVAASCHCLCNHLSHFITGDVIFAVISAVAITFNNTIGCELCNCIVRPVTGRNIAKWICCRKCGGRSSDYESCCQCRYY